MSARGKNTGMEKNYEKEKTRDKRKRNVDGDKEERRKNGRT